MHELARTIGTRIKELRGAPGGSRGAANAGPALTAADVASAAREIGIPWRISTVRAIELGDRKIWAVEFLFLGEIFRRAWAHKGVDVLMPLATFLPQEPVVAGAVIVDPAGLQDVVSGQPFPPEALEIAGPELLPDLPARATRLEPRWVIPAEDLPPTLDLPQLGREARGEAEQKLARKFGVPPEAIVIAAHARWGMGLTGVRDRELGDVAGLPAETVRTKRGRVTLRLGKELEDDAKRVQSLLTGVSEQLPGQDLGGVDQATAGRGSADDTLAEYERLVSLPWRDALADSERVWMIIHPLDQQRRHRRHLRDFKRVTEEAGHDWLEVDLVIHVTQGWDPQEPSTLDGFMAYAEALVEGILGSAQVDDDTVVALDGVGRNFPAERFSELLQRLSSLVPGRLLVFLPGPEEGGASQLLTGRAGRDFLATTITGPRRGA